MKENSKFGSALENFPKELIDSYTKRHTTAKFDNRGHIVKDSDGKTVYAVDSKNLKQSLRSWAREFSANGMSIEDINFEDFKLEGFKPDKIPRKCVTILQYRDKFFIYDKRTSGSGMIYGNDRLYHEKKGRYVQVNKIPDYQLIYNSDNIWVIPEEEFKTDVYDLRRSRAERQSGYQKRYTDPQKRPWVWSGEGYYDKSGYLVNTRLLKTRLDKFKNEKLLGKYGGGDLAENSKKLALEVAEQFNSKVSFILDGINKMVNSGDFESLPTSDVIREIRETRQNLKRLTDRLEYYLKEYGADKAISEVIPDFKSFWERGYSGGRELDKIFNYIKSYTEETKPGATESIRGQSCCRELNSTESIFLPKSIMAAFED